MLWRDAGGQGHAQGLRGALPVGLGERARAGGGGGGWRQLGRSRRRLQPRRVQHHGAHGVLATQGLEQARVLGRRQRQAAGRAGVALPADVDVHAVAAARGAHAVVEAAVVVGVALGDLVVARQQRPRAEEAAACEGVAAVGQATLVAAAVAVVVAADGAAGVGAAGLVLARRLGVGAQLHRVALAAGVAPEHDHAVVVGPAAGVDARVGVVAQRQDDAAARGQVGLHGGVAVLLHLCGVELKALALGEAGGVGQAAGHDAAGGLGWRRGRDRRRRGRRRRSGRAGQAQQLAGEDEVGVAQLRVGGDQRVERDTEARRDAGQRVAALHRDAALGRRQLDAVADEDAVGVADLRVGLEQRLQADTVALGDGRERVATAHGHAVAAGSQRARAAVAAAGLDGGGAHRGSLRPGWRGCPP